MSGIVGIVNFDGAPIDRALLSRMTASLDFRGPDARRVWIAERTHESSSGPCVGFGHTLLRTTYEAEHEQQPFTLDGNTWIVADCRVDAREELLAKLRAKGRDASLHLPDASLQRPDVELILYAWQVWGEECVEHLLGDFAFAIWDAPRRRLFCARDHMGVKPFYYAHIGSTLIFSNTLDCVRMHPAVSDTLNDLAIADFLLFGVNQDPVTTTFDDIQRIPPAHRGTWSIHGLNASRYWTVPIDEPLYLKHASDYTDRFRELLDAAVSDRLRTDKLGIFMSGGLDSTALAATACEISRERSANLEVHAFTMLCDVVLDGKEKEYAELAANALQIPIHYRDERGAANVPDWVDSVFHTPEPCPHPAGLMNDWNEYQEIASHTRVQFYGEGPDNALQYEWQPYLTRLVEGRKFGRLLRDVSSHAVKHRRIPLLPSLPGILKARRRGKWWQSSYPTWLNENFESRLQLRARWEQHERDASVGSIHPVRPAAFRAFTGPYWEAFLCGYDGERTKVPLEVRHPFLDIRVLRYMMAVPAVPWCRTKHLIRAAMRGSLPDPVLRRPKAPLKSDPEWDAARKSGLASLVPVPAFRDYISSQHIPDSAGEDMVAYRTDSRPRALNYWLQNLPQGPDNNKEEVFNGAVFESANR